MLSESAKCYQYRTRFGAFPNQANQGLDLHKIREETRGNGELWGRERSDHTSPHIHTFHYLFYLLGKLPPNRIAPFEQSICRASFLQLSHS